MSFSDILRQFWTSHDPTQGMGRVTIVERSTEVVSTVTKEQEQAAKASAVAYDAELKKAKRGLDQRDSSKYHPITTEIIIRLQHFTTPRTTISNIWTSQSRQYCSAQPQGCKSSCK